MFYKCEFRKLLFLLAVPAAMARMNRNFCLIAFMTITSNFSQSLSLTGQYPCAIHVQKRSEASTCLPSTRLVSL